MLRGSSWLQTHALPFGEIISLMVPDPLVSLISLQNSSESRNFLTTVSTVGVNWLGHSSGLVRLSRESSSNCNEQPWAASVGAKQGKDTKGDNIQDANCHSFSLVVQSCYPLC